MGGIIFWAVTALLALFGCYYLLDGLKKKVPALKMPCSIIKFIVSVPLLLFIGTLFLPVLEFHFPFLFVPSPQQVFREYFEGSPNSVTDLQGSEFTWKSTVVWVQFHSKLPITLKDAFRYQDTDCRTLHLVVDKSPLGKERLASLIKTGSGRPVHYEDDMNSPYQLLIASSQCKKLKAGMETEHEEEREFLYHPATQTYYLGVYYH